MPGAARLPGGLRGRACWARRKRRRRRRRRRRRCAGRRGEGPKAVQPSPKCPTWRGRGEPVTAASRDRWGWAGAAGHARPSSWAGPVPRLAVRGGALRSPEGKRRPAGHPGNHSTNRSKDQRTNRPMDQPVNQPMDQPVNRSTNRSTPVSAAPTARPPGGRRTSRQPRSPRGPRQGRRGRGGVRGELSYRHAARKRKRTRKRKRMRMRTSEQGGPPRPGPRTTGRAPARADLAALAHPARRRRRAAGPPSSAAARTPHGHRSRPRAKAEHRGRVERRPGPSRHAAREPARKRAWPPPSRCRPRRPDRAPPTASARQPVRPPSLPVGSLPVRRRPRPRSPSSFAARTPRGHRSRPGMPGAARQAGRPRRAGPEARLPQWAGKPWRPRCRWRRWPPCRSWASVPKPPPYGHSPVTAAWAGRPGP